MAAGGCCRALSAMRLGQIRLNLAFEDGDQCRIHVGKIIWDAQANDPGMSQMALKLPRQLAAMHRFHHKDQFGPAQQFRRNRGLGIVIQTG